MKTMKAIFFILFAYFFTGSIFAQGDVRFLSSDDIKRLKDRQMIVVVSVPDPKIVSKFEGKSKPKVVEEYEQIIKNYNDNMKACVTKFWTINTGEVLYKTRAEVNEMMKDKSNMDKYYLMYCYSIGTDGYKSDFSWSINGSGQKIEGHNTNFAIEIPGDKDKFGVHKIFDQDEFNGLIPTAVELATFILARNYNFNYILNNNGKIEKDIMLKENMNKLKNKTLLVLKDKLNPKIVDDLGKFYPGKFKLVDEDEMIKAIVSANPDDAYLIKTNFAYVIDCKDGATLGYSYKGISHSESGIAKDCFQDLAKYCK